MCLKKNNFCFVLFLIGFLGFAQTPDYLLRGSNSSQDIQSNPILIKNKKVNKIDRSVSENSSKIVNRASSPQAGTTPAEFSVSLSGAATYNVPIATPPGIKDINPNVGLSFNSQAANGLAGWGWNVSGLSSITRVASNKFYDDFIDGVDFDSYDRFSLDGQRLILKSGVYGADGSEYQTEKYSNIKIKAFGVSSFGASFGPSYFLLIYPDGSRAWYGSGGSARGKLEWAINEWQDPQGNYIKYNYSTTNNLKTIDKISFGTRVGMSAPVEINFHYKNRKRPEVAYVNDNTFKRSNILERIEVKGNGELFRKYVLTHNETNFGYERLISIQEFNKSNESLSPILFSYDNSSNNISPDTFSGTVYPGYNYQTDAILSGDFNGDTDVDFILYNKNTKNKIHIFDNIFESSYNNTEIGRTYDVPHFDAVIGNNILNQQNKLLSNQGITFIKENITGNYTNVDFKSYYSGSVGLYYQYTKTWTAPTYLYQNSPTSSVRKKIPHEYVSGDFNGDGLTDVLAIGKPYTNRSCFVHECPSNVLPDCIDPNELKTNNKNSSFENFTLFKKTIDKNNNEVIESYLPPNEECEGGNNTCYSCNVYTVNNRNIYFIDLDKNLTTNFVNLNANLQKNLDENDKILAADFNGDGKSNLLHFSEGKLFIYELDSNNQFILIYTETDSNIKMDQPVILGDFNGDSKMDFVVPTENNSYNWKFFLSKGNSIYKYTKQLGFNYYESKYNTLHNFPGSNQFIESNAEVRYSAMDINGDGKSDFVRHAIVVSLSGSQSEDVVRAYVNKLNENDSTPSFEEVQVHYEVNSGISSFGIPVQLNLDKKNNLEYAYLSSNFVIAHKFEGNHLKDVTLNQISNNGVVNEIDYFNLSTEGDEYEPVYTGNLDEIYPFINVNIVPTLKLVSEVREISGGFNRTQRFRYSGAASHVHGLGFLGFKQVVRSNIYGSGIQTLWNISDYDIQKRGALLRSWVSEYLSSTPYNYISKNDYNYSTQLTSEKVFINAQTQIVSEDALTGITRTEAFIYDLFYNPTNITTTYPGGSETVVKEYINNPSPFNSTYSIGRISNKTVTNILNGDLFSTREEYIYDNNLVTQIKRKGNDTPWLNQHYIHDAFGNILQKKVSASGVSDRIENFEFDTSGRYMTSSIDDEGLETTYTYNITTGNPASVINANNLPISYQYDDWGRIIIQTNYLGKHTYTTYENSTTFGAGGLLKTINYDQGQDEKTYYNALGWVMKQGVLSINNKWIFKSYEYDVAGKNLKESEPYFNTASPTQWNQYYFDEYSRPITQQLYTGKIINTTYNGLSATVDDGIKTVTSTKDAIGNIISIQDEGGTINYTYYANGKMKSTNYNGHIVSVTIDGWGRKSGLTDPSAGTYAYQYNIFGDLLQESSPTGTTNYEYSSIGKLIRKEIVGDQTNIATDYEYYDATKLLKRMQAIDSETGTQYEYNYYYDGNKRINKITEDNGTANFEKQLIYDLYGRVEKETYITNNTSSGASNTVNVKNVYDPATGILREIRDFNTNTLLWRINTEDARGKALSISLGNDIMKTKQYDQYGFLENIYDRKLELAPPNEPQPDAIVALKMDYDFNYQRGILNNRKNYAFNNWDEGFSYDNLNRLTQISGAVNHQQEYDQRGRITDNSLVGEYNYNNTNAYRLKNIDLNNQGDLYYQQNMLQQVTYNAFKKPVKIYQEDKGRVDFEYGPLMNRTHAYYGGLLEDTNLRQYHKQYSSIIPVEIVEDNSVGSTKIITYIGGDAYSAPIAHIKKEVIGPGALDEYHYLHRDYLGSILAISNSSAEIVEQRQFGAWGVVDKFLNIHGETTFNHNSLIDRGFTGHEHFFEVALIHMNGRMYDAKFGRFLSPDNFIQDPYNTQSFNRYGYVWNNPLSFSDPSGDFIWAAVIAGAIIGAVAGAAAYVGSAIQSGDWNWGSFGLSILGGAIVGGITGGIGGTAALGGGALWSAAATGFVGSFFSITVPIGDWSISVSPSIAFGNASGFGASLSAGYSDGNWSFSAGIGYMNYGDYNGFGNGTEIRKSILAAYDDGKTGFSLGTNWWSGSMGGGNDDFHQQTGVIGIRSGDFKIRYENDGKPFSGFSGDGNDQYRTAALNLSVGEYSVGFNLFTGKRNQESYDEERSSKHDGNIGDIGPYTPGKYGEHYKNGLVYEQDTPYRLGALTFGYKGYRLGVNSEWVRHAIQNVAIHGSPAWLAGQRMFEMQSDTWNGYVQYKTPNMFTSW